MRSVKLTARLLLDLVNDFIRHAKVLDVVSPDIALWDLVEFVSVLFTVKRGEGGGGKQPSALQVRIELWVCVLCISTCVRV